MVLALMLLLQEETLSGPQKGEQLTPFKIVDVATTKEVEIEFKKGASLLVFIHELTRPAAQCFRPLDDYAAKHPELNTLFVYLSEDQDGAERHLPVVVQSVKLKSKLGVSIDGKEGPGAYGLNKKVTLTVLVAKDGFVMANFAILSPNETDAPKILKALDNLLAPVTLEEMRAEILRLREEIRALRDEVDALRKQIPAKRPEPDPKLANLYRKIINRDATDDQVDAAIQELEEIVKAEPKHKKAVIDQMALMVKANYGSEYARKKMDELKARLEKM